MKKDYSEFQFDDNDSYRAIRENTPDMRLDFFRNSVHFSEEKKTLSILVDDEYEYETMQPFIGDVRKEELFGRYSNKDDVEKLKSAWKSIMLEDAKTEQENTAIKDDFIRRYNGNIRFGFQREGPAYMFQKPLINVLSGAAVRLGYGEGLLDFLYADFDTPLKECADFHKELCNALRGGTDFDKTKTTEKTYSQVHQKKEDFFEYVSTFQTLKKASYQSIYTTICPPVFTENSDKSQLVMRYWQYLLALQREYKEILEFCYDENFHPEVLSKLMPHERYALYRCAHGLPNYSTRTERVLFSINHMGIKQKMPYGMEPEDIWKRFNDTESSDPNEAEKEFAEQLHIKADDLHFLVGMPTFISIAYTFGTVEQILELELTKILEQNIRFRKCKRCGKYFIMKGNYDTNYCDRVVEGGTQTCQQLAAQENYKARNADNKAIPIYSKYYKRYAARMKVKQIKEEDFNAWRYQAIRKRDECSDGKITPEEFTEWMEASFPNRKPRKPAEETNK